MKKWSFFFGALLSLFVLLFSGCNTTEAPEPSIESSASVSVAQSPTLQDAENLSLSPEQYQSLESVFSSPLQGIWSVSDRLFAQSDNTLYWVDESCTPHAICPTEKDTYQCSVQELDEGYAFLSFSLTKFNYVRLDQDCQVDGTYTVAEGDTCGSITAQSVAVSKDGTYVAYCPLVGVNLFQVSDESTRTLFSPSDDVWDNLTNTPTLCAVQYLVFSEDDSHLIFSGAYAIKGQDEAKNICGIMDLEGTIQLMPITAISEDLFGDSWFVRCGSGAIYTEDSRSVDGHALYLIGNDLYQTSIAFSSSTEGNFVYTSPTGAFLATISGDYNVDSGSYTIRIYGFENGTVTLFNTQQIDLGTYAAPPTILLQESGRVCAAVFGADPYSTETIIKSWTF